MKNERAQLWAGALHEKTTQHFVKVTRGHLNHLIPIIKQCMKLNLDSSKRRIMGKKRVKASQRVHKLNSGAL